MYLLFVASQDDAGPDKMLGQIPERDDLVRAITHVPFVLQNGLIALAIVVMQGLLLFPARTPRLTGDRGKGVRLSLTVAGFAIAALVLGLVWSIVSVAAAYAGPAAGPAFGVGSGAASGALPNDVVIFAGSVLVVLVAWVFATVLLCRFVRPGPVEGVISVVSRRLFMGTVVEAVLLIPLDVMIRRKTGCYCAEGTYWALIWCGSIGLLAAGPAVFLPLLVRRRRSWYADHCGSCGYDMRGDRDAALCPECGTAWAGSDVIGADEGGSDEAGSDEGGVDAGGARRES